MTERSAIVTGGGSGIGLAKQKWPESLHAVDGDLPRTPSGKVQKYRLRQSLRDGQPWK